MTDSSSSDDYRHQNTQLIEFNPSRSSRQVDRPRKAVTPISRRKASYTREDPRNEGRGRIWPLAAVVAAVVLGYLAWSHVRNRGGSLASWIPNADEITIQRDPRTKEWGIRYSMSLMLTYVDDRSPAKAAGLQSFLGRRITHVNGISVLDAESFRTIESRIADGLTLRFAPSSFVVGVNVRVMKRILLRGGATIEPGTEGVVVRVPGEIDGSVASIKTPNVGLWDAYPDQVEPYTEAVQLTAGMTVRTLRAVVMQSGKVVPQGAVGVVVRVPGEFPGSEAEVIVSGMRWDALPGHLEVVSGTKMETPSPPSLASEEVVQLLESLGHQQYMPRLVAFGLDRLDFLAVATKRDGIALGIRPAHWKRIVLEARRRVPLSGRGRSGLEQLCADLGEKALLPALLRYGLDRLDQVAKAQPQDGQALKVKPQHWERIVDEARKRVNMTSTNMDEPQNPEQQVVYRLLKDVGLQRHFRRYIVFGLDSLDRISTKHNLSSTIDVQGWEWDRIRTEAMRRLSGHAPVRQTSVDPQSEKVEDLATHEMLAQKYDNEDTQNAHAVNTLQGGHTGDYAGGAGGTGVGNQGVGSLVDDLVNEAEKKEQQARSRLQGQIQRLSELGIRGQVDVLGNEHQIQSL